MRWQAAPTWKDIETHTTVEKVNKDLRPNQIKLKLEASPDLIASGASYIKFCLNANEEIKFED